MHMSKLQLRSNGLGCKKHFNGKVSEWLEIDKKDSGFEVLVGNKRV